MVNATEFARGFGFSYRTREPVLNEIADRLPNTIYLMGITLLSS